MIDFRDDGFDVRKRVVNRSLIRDLTIQIARQMANNPHQSPIIQNPHLGCADWSNLILQTGLACSVAFPLKEELYVENCIVITKAGHSEFSVPMHQDGVNDRIRLHPEEAASAWIPLVNINEKSGGLIVFPGSHRLGYRAFSRKPECAGSALGSPISLDSDEAILDNPKSVRCYAGDAVFMDVRLIHYSDANKDDIDRPALNLRLVTALELSSRDSSLHPLLPIAK